jgi:hypothetical protein
MRLILLLFLCASAAAEERAFLELETPRETVYAQESVRLALRIGFDRDYFRTNAVPLFRRPMDVPVQVTAPWIDGLGSLKLLSSPRGRATPTFALNDDVIACTRTEEVRRNGRTFTVLVVERVYRPEHPGDIVIPAPRLRFAYGTVFEEDFINGRRATDRREESVDGERLLLRVRPLPEEGRPPEFGDAVGRFTVRAKTSARTLDAGQSFRLTLHIEGHGNLDVLRRPTLDGLAGFHVFGAIEDRSTTRLTVRYDLSPLDGSVTEIPTIPFAFFDPGPAAGYCVVKTEPIPLDVKGVKGVAGGAPIASKSEEPAGRSSTPLIALGAVVILGAIGLLLRARAGRRDRPDPEQERASAAATTFRTRLEDPDADVADALAEFLAAHLRCTSAAVIAPGLDARLVTAGVPADLAARTAVLLESLVATRYGGRTSEEDGEAARAVVDEFQSVFVERLA